MITSAKEEQKMISTCRKVSSAKSVLKNVQFIYLGGAFTKILTFTYYSSCIHFIGYIDTIYL